MRRLFSMALVFICASALPAQQVAVAPDSLTLTVGDTARVVATVKGRIDAAVSYSGSDAGVFTAHRDGRITARGVGCAWSQVSYGTWTRARIPVCVVAASVDTEPTPASSSALYEEAWRYASSSEMRAAFSELYVESARAPYTTGTASVALGVDADGTRFYRATFPDVSSWTGDVVVVNGQPDRTDDYTVRPALSFPNAAHAITGFELAVRVRFSPNWTTSVPWGEGAQDHKTLLVYGYPIERRWSIKLGAGIGPYGPAVKVGDPGEADRLPNVRDYYAGHREAHAATYWDGAWHTLTLRVRGLGTTAGATETLLDGVVIDRVSGRDYRALTGLSFWNPGANRNQGQHETMTFDVGTATLRGLP